MKNNLLEVPEDAMFGLIASIPNSTHIKSIQNGKYITTNKSNLKTYGFTNRERIYWDNVQ